MTSLLKALTNPSAVALIGTSDNPAKLTARPLLFLQQHGFEGKIYPVNPVRETVQGSKAYPSVESIPDRVDHAYILVSTEQAITALEDCARAGVRVVSILADGFAETGSVGQERQQRLTAIAEEANILLIGPNSMGVVDTRTGFVATTNAAFKTDKLNPGRLAVISQSGSVIGTLISRGQARGIDFATLISVGNEALNGVGEIANLLLQDDGIDGFVLFMETIRNPQVLAGFARKAHAAGKPVVGYMIGRSEEGQALAVTHTGALTGNAMAVSSFLRSAGIAVVSQFDALFEAPAALAKRDLLQGRPKQVTVVSTTGGGGAMVIDQLSLRGVTIAPCSEQSRRALSKLDIPLGQGKLVDVTLAGARYETMKAVVSQLISDPDTGVLLVAIGSSAQFNPELAVTPIIDAVAECGDAAAPVFGFPIPHALDSLHMLEAGGVPAFHTVESCADSIALLLKGSAPKALVKAVAPAAANKLIENAPSGVINEIGSSEVFSSLGVSLPKQLVLAVDEKIPPGLDLAFPVVAKLVSGDLPHKTESGALSIGIGSVAELEEKIAGMRASVTNKQGNVQIDGVLVQEMCVGLGEALVGLTRDPLVGAMVTVAAGGVMTEIYKDTSVRPAPVSVATAHEMIDEVLGFALLRGYRGSTKADLDALAELVASVSQLANIESVAEAELNPVLIRAEGDGVVLLDALIRKS